MNELKLSDDELVALLALVGIGVMTYVAKPVGPHHRRALDRLPKATLDRLTDKLNSVMTQCLAQKRSMNDHDHA